VEGATTINAKYADYLAGKYTLTADERDQIGMRLAKQLGHTRLYAVDHKLDMDLDAVMSAAQHSNDTAFLQTFQGAIAGFQDFEKRKVSMTVRDALAEMNAPSEVA